MQDTRCVSYCSMVKGPKYHFFVVDLLYFTQVSDLARAGWKPNVAHSPGRAKRHPGYRVLEQSRPVRAKALRHGAGIEQNIHTMFLFKIAKSAIKQG